VLWVLASSGLTPTRDPVAAPPKGAAHSSLPGVRGDVQGPDLFDAKNFPMRLK